MSTHAAAVRPAESARVAETVPSSTVSASRDAGASGGRAPFSAPTADARVSTLLAPRVQRETRVSSPTDPAEREAVATARKVMRMAAPPAPPSSTRASAPARTGLNASPLLRAPAIHRSISSAPPSTIQRAPAAAPKPHAGAARVPRADDVMPEIRSEMGGGTPLPPSVRGFLEPRFRAGFGAVRIHTNEKAAGIAARLAARAFTFGKHIFFGKGEYRPNDPAGMELIAHELTHTIQQKEVVQRQEEVTVSERSEPAVQRLGFGDILDWLANQANAIPGFRMFTIVLGVNPVNMSPVERSAANILRAVVEFIPGGNLVTRALDTYGIFDRAGGWIEGQIRGLGMVGSTFKSAITRFIASLGLGDLVRPGSVWDRARRIFTDPIDRLKRFAAGLLGGILDLLRDAVLRPLARLAEGTQAYGLLKAVLGRDPVTGDPVPQTADALIGGFMTLIGQQEVYENIKRGNAVARAMAWFRGVLSGAVAFVSAVPGLIVSTLRSITLDDVLPITNLFGKVGRAFGGFVGSFLSWGLNQVLGLLQIIFEVVAPSVMPYVRRAAGAFQQIVRNPAGFVGNLVRAGIQGFRQFGGNFLGHLRRSLIGWLTGTMAGAGIYVPQALNLREVIKFVLSVLGLTWANIRQKLVRVVGETAVAAMEAGFAIVRTLVTQGPAAAWEQIREGIGNLQEMVMGQVMTFVRNRVVQAAITTLASSLIPGAGFIRAILAIYDTVTFFVQRLRQIGAVVAAYIDSIAAIAAGNIGSAANRVETTMAGMLTLVVSFLAQIARLGNVSAAVLGIINRVRAPIDRALDRVVAWIVAQARRLGQLIARGARTVLEWWRLRRRFRARDGRGHSIYFNGTGRGARLMLHSDSENVVLTFLTGYQGPGEIARARTAYGRLMEHIDAMNALMAREPSVRAREIPRLEPLIRQEADALTQALATLNIDVVNAQRVMRANVTFTPGSAVKRAEAGPLTQIPGTTVGTPTSGPVLTDELKELRMRNVDPERENLARLWIQMHLLTHLLHGPAARPNLVLAPQTLNRSFASHESTVHGRVRSGKLYYYAVEAELHPDPDHYFLKRLRYVARELTPDDLEQAGAGVWRVKNKPTSLTVFGGDQRAPSATVPQAARDLVAQIPTLSNDSNNVLGIDTGDLRAQQIAVELMRYVSAAAVDSHFEDSSLSRTWRARDVARRAADRAENLRKERLLPQIDSLLNALNADLAAMTSADARLSRLRTATAALRALPLGRTDIALVFNNRMVRDVDGRPRTDWSPEMRLIRG